MKLTILKGIGRKMVVLLANILELSFRLLFFCMPVGLYYLIVQLRIHATPANVLTTGYLNNKSTWMRVAPGVMIVCVEGEEFSTKIKSWNIPRKIQKLMYFIRALAYLGVTLICAIILYFILFKEGI